MEVERRAMAVEGDRAIWHRYARTGHLLNLAILVIDTAYVLVTWRTGSHRPLLLGLNVAGLAGLVAAIVVVPERVVAASPRRDLIFGGWVFVGACLITVGAWADGGLASPLAWLLPVSVMFTAVAHRPALVFVSGAFAIAGFLVLTGTDSTVATMAPPTAVRLGYLAVLACAAASGARSRWDHHDAQAVLHAELSKLADIDGLTGVLNHRAFHERLAAEVAACDRRSLPVTLLLIDLDHFKAVNDRFGHAAGDHVLRQVGAAIGRAVRGGDLVGRVGGEEFAVCLGASSMGEAHLAAQRVHAALTAIVDPEPITASIGIGSATGGGTMTADLLGRADEALYLAKHQGRNRTCWLRVA